MKMKLSDFRRKFYAPGSAPKLSTLRKRIQAGVLPGGVREGNRYYVDLDKYGRENAVRDEIAQRKAELEKQLQGLV